MTLRAASGKAIGLIVIVAVAAYVAWYWGTPPEGGKRNADVVTEPPRPRVGSNSSPIKTMAPNETSGGTMMPQEIPPHPAPETGGAESAELPPIRPALALNTELAATFVGSDACAECHADEHQGYLQTTHSRSFREVDPSREPPDDVLHDPISRRSYQLYREDDQFRHRETLNLIDGQQDPAGPHLQLADYACRYAVGSGEHALTYLVEAKDGFLAESPVSWYASLKTWALSPGFEDYNTGFARPVYADCLFCHTGRSEAIDGNRGRIKIQTKSIDCERCHGPGSLHVERQRTDPGAALTGSPTIVNPKHLSRGQNEAICAQCHLDGAAQADIRGRSLGDFRPGQWLEDYRVYYGMQVPRTSMKVVGHVEQLHLSQCYRGDETLTCVTCHDPHGVPAAEDRVAFFRAKCVSCHSQQSCSLPEPERLKQSPADNCMSCHMPTSPTDIVHVPATHHRIGIHRQDVEDASPPHAGELIPLLDVSHLPRLEQDRCLGLGYLDASIKSGEPTRSEAFRVRARELLEDVRRRGLVDPTVDAALAKIYQRENPPQAIVFAEAALQAPQLEVETRIEALFALSNAYIAMRQTPLAIQPLEQLTSLRRQAGDWFLLGVCRFQAGELEAALTAAHRAAEIRPDKPNFQALIAELYRQTGEAELAAQHELRAQQLAGPQPAGPQPATP